MNKALKIVFKVLTDIKYKFHLQIIDQRRIYKIWFIKSTWLVLNLLVLTDGCGIGNAKVYKISVCSK